MKQDQIHLRVSTDEKEEIRKKANNEGRSVSSFLLWLVKTYKGEQ